MLQNKYIPYLLCLMFFGLSHPALAKDYRWSEDLSAEQMQRAQEILREAAPKIKVLRKALQEKIQELKNFTYTNGQDPQTLAILGQELQERRQNLRQELKNLDEKLFEELGASLGGYRGRDCTSLARERVHDQQNIEKSQHTSSHHID